MTSTSSFNAQLPHISTANSSTQQRNPWTPQTGHANADPDTAANVDINTDVKKTSPLPTLPPPSLSSSSSPPTIRPPSDTTSRAGISIRAFLLGIAFGISLPSIFLLLVIYQSPLWRLPFFLLTLSQFHFLEYYITAQFNPAAATTSAFLLSSNGSAYNVAHTLAFLECAVRWYFFSWPVEEQRRRGGLGQSWFDVGLGIGLLLLVVGQVTRTMAMAQAGSNFNHLVQSKKKQGHVLVTNGIYAWLRHPSYFGFFWWGLGTQLVLGNVLCLVGYAAVLWRFFRKRIEGKVPPTLIRSGGDLFLPFKRTKLIISFHIHSGRGIACGFLRKRIPAISRTNSSRHTIHPLILGDSIIYYLSMDFKML